MIEEKPDFTETIETIHVNSTPTQIKDSIDIDIDINLAKTIFFLFVFLILISLIH